MIKTKNVPQNPHILRCHRLMEAFARADDERDFYLDREEGFLVYIDLDKSEEELLAIEKEFKTATSRYVPIPKMTFYEVKKLMEGFVNEKVYDIDTKEKLLDIISSKEAKENFLEFIYDHHSELEKWQTYYIERSRVRIIEWLRNNQFTFVFEEDLELTKTIVEKLKMSLFDPKVSKDLVAARKQLQAKAKTYYSSEALNPRPKRGRPPKQVAKVETEPQFSQDIYTTVPKPVKPFLYVPEYKGTSAIVIFSGKFSSEEDLLKHKRQSLQTLANIEMQNIDQKLATLRTISSQWIQKTKVEPPVSPVKKEEEDVEDVEIQKPIPKKVPQLPPAKKEPVKPIQKSVKSAPIKQAAIKKQPVAKKAAPKKLVSKKALPVMKKATPKKIVQQKKVSKGTFTKRK